MCGIGGIIGRVGEPNRRALERMSHAMHHRGPDAHGTWESPPDESGRGVLLAHRRLSILDLTPAGAQPMVEPTTGDALVFNGEIYNYAALRERLRATGESIASTGDTAVLARALARHGSEALPWLRGMFAFAFWDREDRTLLLARDPLGIKPLYFARNPDPEGEWSFAFASEVRALLASGLLGKPKLNPAAVASVVWNGFVVGPDTAVQGVELMPAGRMLQLDARGADRIARDFWSLPPPSAPSLGEADVATVLEEGLGLHLSSDVPLAVFLSAGVDSSAVANLAQKASRDPIHTFTLAFEEQELNEGPFARRIAEAIGSQHHEVVLTEDTFVSHLEPALDSLDQPSFDGLNSYYMSRAIRDAGFTVALVGTGGDELFGGYPSFRDLPVLHRWARRMKWMPGEILETAATLGTAPLRRAGGEIPPQTRWAKLPDIVRSRDDLKSLYQLAYAIFLPDFQRQLLASGIADTLPDGLPPAMSARLAAEIAGRSPLATVGVLEQRLFLGERLLRDNDAASMAASIEQRVPLVDHLLLEAVNRLPDAQRFEPLGRKEMLRRIGLRGLDPALFERPKSGFVLPFNRWIRQGLKGAMDATLRDPAAVAAAGLAPAPVARMWKAFLDGAPGMYWSRVWAIYVLVRWCSRHGVRI